MANPIVVMFGDIVEANGKTIRENNQERGHRYPLGDLVQLEYNSYFGGACGSATYAHLHVVAHTRDCDGSPLYMLASKPPEEWEESFGITVEEYRELGVMTQRHLLVSAMAHVEINFNEDCLTPIKQPEDAHTGRYVPTINGMKL